MSKQHFGSTCSPFDPYSKARLGWIDPIEVSDSLSDQAITDFMSTGGVYKLWHDPHEYFLVSNHKRDPPNTSPWELGFPGKGLLIWHVDTTGSNTLDDMHKLVDLEAADGLYLGGDPDDSLGIDSLDWGRIGYYWCFWNSTTKQAFDETSNPTSDGYVYDSQLGVWKQTVLTGVLIDDIQGAGGDTMWADLYSPYSPHIWWGPDTVYITGDFVVKPGSKLTILPGTVVEFDTTDDQQGGSQASKCELIVKGNFQALGTQQDSIYFLSISSTPSDSDWYGIRVDVGGSAKLSYCNLLHAYTGINYRNSTTDSVTHCRFRNNLMHGLRIENSAVLVDDCVIEKDWVGIDDSYGTGIHLRGANATIQNTLIQGYLYGIYVDQKIKGIRPQPSIEECGFYNIGHTGIYCYQSNPTIQKCCFKGAYGEHGICFNAGSPYVDRCYMASEHDSIPIGIAFGGAATGSIRRTTIWDYGTCAVHILGPSNPDLGNSDSIGCNWFEETDHYYVIAGGSSTILAKSNYWDVDDGDTAGIREKIIGPVDIDPILGKCDHCFPCYSDQCSDLPPSDPEFEACKILATGEGDATSRGFSLSQNYPNPFNPQTVIKYDLPRPAHVKLTIYNVLGQKVRTVVDEHQDAGGKTLFWDGTDDGGKGVASGVYFFWLRADEFEAAKRMILVR